MHAFFYKQDPAEIGKKLSKSKQHPEAEFLTNMPKKQVSLCQWDYAFNFNENENEK